MNRKITIAGALAAVLALSGAAAYASSGESVELTVLMYHHVADVGDDNVTVSVERFDEQLAFLAEEGYVTVGFEELIAYVDSGVELPEKCVALVFDDGYRSNYELAFPILEKYGAKATVSLIGDFVGDETYKATGVPILPYLDWSEAREMLDSGLVSYASHTHDMHQSPDFDGERLSAARLEGESREDFEAALRADNARLCELFEGELGFTPTVFAYPNGDYSREAEKILRELGYRVTLTTKIGTNRIRKGQPESLYLLRRYNVNDSTDLETLENYLAGKRR